MLLGDMTTPTALKLKFTGIITAGMFVVPAPAMLGSVPTIVKGTSKLVLVQTATCGGGGVVPFPLLFPLLLAVVPGLMEHVEFWARLLRLRCDVDLCQGAVLGIRDFIK